jgi:hypothetical protein
MDEATTSNIIRWYEGLEEEIVDFLRCVPPQDQNMNTWSPRLATVIVEACGYCLSLENFYVRRGKKSLKLKVGLRLPAFHNVSQETKERS